MAKVYALPNTDSYLITETNAEHLLNQGYIEMISTPPKLSHTERLDGYVYMCDEIGQWILTKDPRHDDKIIAAIKRSYKVDHVTPNMLKLIANKLLKLAEEIK